MTWCTITKPIKIESTSFNTMSFSKSSMCFRNEFYSFCLFCFVVKPEVKLSELSEVVGNYEKLRLQDQQAIQKLKERLQKLDVENATLTRQISVDENRMPDNERDLGEDETPEELKKQVFKLKGLLKIAMDSSDKPLDLGMDCTVIFHRLL